MPLRPCLDCNRLTPGSRCGGCRNARDRITLRAKRERRPYTRTEQERRAQAVAAWISSNGYVCPGYHRSPHHSRDLTAEHPHAVARGGAEDQPLTVLCRSCNSSKGDAA